MSRVRVEAKLIRWARERSGVASESLSGQFPKYEEWEAGTLSPTWKQLEKLSAKTYTPLGFFFLSEPPEEALPIPDFRTLPVRSGHPGRPSPALLETIQSMQQRQAWLGEALQEDGADPLPFVGEANAAETPEAVAARMRDVLELEEGWSRRIRTWEEAVSELRRAIEATGVLAVINGVVGNNTHRPLAVEEFRGFALCDAYAPLVFVNGSDTRSAQMFTLAHELAHVWLGREGLSDLDAFDPHGDSTEIWCNKVAAEFLVPALLLRNTWAEARDSDSPFVFLARRFKVSPVVAARRAQDLGLITREDFLSFYQSYQAQEYHRSRRRSGGDFYRTQNSRVGERFAAAVVRAAREGRLLYRDAYELTGLRGKTFESYAGHLGLDIL